MSGTVHTINLLPHQKKAVSELENGNILCGGVGTGKSLTALAYYFMRVCRGVLWNETVVGPMIEPVPLYIITTAAVRNKGGWTLELVKFDIDPSTVVVDSWNNLHKYTEVKGAFFIFDEQRVKGRGEWVKSFYKVAKKNQWILLSATPGDSWMDYIPVFVANGFYKNRSEFLNRHAVFSPFVTKFPKLEKWVDVSYLEFLRRKITVLMKYDKRAVQHWHELIEPYNEARYRTILKKRIDPWTGEPIEEIGKACYLLRRAACFEEGRRNALFWLGIKHPKLIVFYNYDYELEAIKEVLVENRKTMKGQLSEEELNYEIGEWNGHRHDPVPKSERWFYLVQYNAGAEGWNCVDTDTIAFFSMSYSYSAMTQAAGRIDRLNTPFAELNYYVFKSLAPIDKAISQALKNKKDFNEAAFWKGQVLRSNKVS